MTGVLGPYAALSWRFEVVVDAPETRREVERVLEPLRAANPTSPSVRYRLTYSSEGPSHLLRDGVVVSASYSQGHLYRALLWDVNQGVTATGGDFVLLHAGVISTGGRAVLLPAASGSGKSTLTAALVRSGMDYLTDETAAVVPHSRLVHAFPKALTLKEGSWSLFPEAAPEAHSGLTSHQWHVLPQSLRSTAREVPEAEVALLVFPRHDPAAVGRLERLTPGRALLAAADCLFRAERDRARDLATLGVLCEAVPAYRLSFSGLDGATRTIWHALAA